MLLAALRRIAVACALVASAPAGAEDWPMFGRDHTNRHFSPLTSIHRKFWPLLEVFQDPANLFYKEYMPVPPLLIRPAITSASCSCSLTFTTAMRSTSPAHE